MEWFVWFLISLLVLCIILSPVCIVGFGAGVYLNLVTRKLYDWGDSETEGSAVVWDNIHRMFTVLVIVAFIIWLLGGLMFFAPFAAAIWDIDLGLIIGFVSAFWNKKVKVPFTQSEIGTIRNPSDVAIYAEMSLVRARYLMKWWYRINNVALISRLVKNELELFWRGIKNGKK